MSDDGIELDAGDVYVTPLDMLDCEECGSAPITHYVSIDLRANGQMSDIFRGCEKCCESFAATLRESLPSSMEEASRG